MTKLFNKNGRNYHSVKLWLFRLYSYVTFLPVLVAGGARYFLLKDVVENNIDRINEEGDGAEFYVGVGRLLLLVFDLIAAYKAVRKLHPVPSDPDLAVYNAYKNDMTYQHFRDKLHHTLEEQGYYCSKEDILVHYQREESVILSVSEHYRSLFSSKKYLRLAVYDNALSRWVNPVSNQTDFDGPYGMFVFHHEARHIVGGHTTPRKQVGVMLLLASVTFALQSVLIGLFCLLDSMFGLNIFPNTAAVNSFKFSALLSATLLMAAFFFGVKERAWVATEHDADREAVTRVADRFHSDQVELIDSEATTATCCFRFFRKPVYMSTNELEQAYHYEFFEKDRLIKWRLLAQDEGLASEGDVELTELNQSSDNDNEGHHSDQASESSLSLLGPRSV